MSVTVEEGAICGLQSDSMYIGDIPILHCTIEYRRMTERIGQEMLYDNNIGTSQRTAGTRPVSSRRLMGNYMRHLFRNLCYCASAYRGILYRRRVI